MVLKDGLRRQPPAKALRGPKDAAGKALRKLMKEAYPEYLLGKGEESAQYDQRFKELKNRLSAGYNWHVLQTRSGRHNVKDREAKTSRRGRLGAKT